MSTWKPTEGLRLAEIVVGLLASEAPTADSVISGVFRHRMVEVISKTLEGAMAGRTMAEATVDAATAPPRHANGHDDEAVHAKADLGGYVAQQLAGMDGMTVVDVDTGKKVKPVKAAKDKPAKKPGKRGRPSKAEIAAREAKA